MKYKLLAIGAITVALAGCSSTSNSDCQLSLVNNGDGTITDTATSLMWTTNDYFRENLASGKGWVNWNNSLVLAQESEFNTHTDWRVPTKDEAMSIVNNTCNAKGTTLADNFTIPMSPLFNNPTYPFFWTSTESGDNAIFINYKTGQAEEAPKTAGNTVRFVRSIK